MNKTRLSVAAMLAASSLSLSACGGGYQVLTKDNFGTKVSQALNAHPSAHVVSTTPDGARSEGDMDFSGASPSVDLTIAKPQAASIELKMIGGVLYFPVPNTGKFIRLDSSTPGIGSTVAVLQQLGPKALGDLFTKGITALKYVGAQTISGATTHHYTLTIDTSKVLSGLNQQALGSIVGSPVVTEEVYLNSDDTVRRFEVSADGDKTKSVVDMTNWGKKVTISAPDSASIVQPGDVGSPSAPAS